MIAPVAEPQFYEVRDVARRFGVADCTVRLWEREGVIPAPARTPAGRRIFTQRDLETIERIRAERAARLAVERGPSI